MPNLEPILQFLHSDSGLWLLGALVFLLAACAFAFLARSKRRGELQQIENARTGLPGAVVPRGTGAGSDRPDDSAVRREPSLRADADTDADFATTLAATEASLAASAMPHTVAEIQKVPLKPLAAALSNTRSSFFGRIKSLFGQQPLLQDGELDDLEEILYTSDLGPKTVQRLLLAVEMQMKEKAKADRGFDAVREALRNEMLGIFQYQNEQGDKALNSVTGLRGNVLPLRPEFVGAAAHESLENLNLSAQRPTVIMIVGVNGAGKTTTIGKLSRRFALSGKKVLVAAGDTFRAAAGDQLKVWTERAQVEIFSPAGVTDPSAVAYAACELALSSAVDVVLIDTAGRLHTQKNLMEELKKMKRVIEKKIPSAPHEVLLVLDSNSGQNALMQAKEFHQALGVTGVILTKLDGTAKGGVALGIACELQLPIKLIGVGEGMDDLRRFSPREFVDSIL
jgi:fused signal recognition particle receptor